jgi:hypothetical protein
MDALEQTETAAPVEAPVSQLTPANEPDELSQLLKEYDEATAAKSEPEPVATDPAADNTGDAQTSELDALLARYTAPDPRISELEGELAGVRGEADRLRAEAHRAQEWQAFQDYAKSLQDQLPPHLPEGWAELKLKAMAHDPQIALAFDYRGVDRQAVSAELARAQLVHAAFQRANDPRIGELNQYIGKLNIAMNAQSILRKARLDILNEANKLPPPLDQEATELKADIAWNMKSQGKRVAEPPPNYGSMDSHTFRRSVREQFGYDPGV